MSPDDPRHGTVNGYSNLGCRCDECRAAIAAYHRTPEYRQKRSEWRWRTGRNQPWTEYLAAIEAQHGTASRAARCKCDDCRRARNEARAKRRQNANPASHGLASSYKNGCRCDPCRKAMVIWNREYRAKRKARATA